MPADQAFTELIRRVQAAEGAAITELVEQYLPEVRLAVRTLLTDAGLRRQFDSMDIVQSVLHNFCARAVQGQFELDTPAHLVALLKKMAYHKFLDHVRYESAQERDYRRREDADTSLRALMPETPGPSTIVAWRDEYGEIHRRLTDEERALMQRWIKGETWAEIAGPRRREQDRLRHKLEGAFARVAEQLSRLRDEPIATDYLKAVCQWVVEQELAAREVAEDVPADRASG